MEAFDPRFIALRGAIAETETITKHYRAFVQKLPIEGGGYTMDHNAIVYMMDGEGRFVSSLDPHESENVKLAELRRIVGSRRRRFW